MGAVFDMVYTTDQVETWLECIGLPRDFRPNHGPGQDLEALTKLMRGALVAMPFDDSEVHYSRHHTVTLDPAGLYQRYVVRRLGGYCMQGNVLFEHMTRALGYDVYSTGSRVRPRTRGIPDKPYLGWVHQVNIFTLSDGRRVATDVAFGGDGPISPLPMEEGAIINNIGTRRTRLVSKSLGRNTLASKNWIYQIQFDTDAEWHDVYCFTEIEFLPQDFDVMSYYTSTSSSSWLTTKYVGTKMIIEDGQIVGKYTIDHGTVKKNVRGQSETLIECQTEAQRIEALEKYFGLFFSEEEREAIKGTPAELR